MKTDTPIFKFLMRRDVQTCQLFDENALKDNYPNALSKTMKYQGNFTHIWLFFMAKVEPMT
jgi:hypothetical protein